MAFKMKGFSGFMPEGPKKTESIVQNYGKKPKEDPTFEYGHEESEKIMKLKREGLVPGPKMREKAGAPKKVKHKDLEKVVDELQGAVKAHGRQAKTIDKHIDDMNSPMTKKGKCSCYDGYSRVKGTAPCAPGSCKENKKSPASKKLKPCQKAAARRKFDVYPSAYANMWASNHKC